MKGRMTTAELHRMARRVLDLCRKRGLRIATAESCTGGLVAGALTEISGSSDVVDRGFVTYSNAAKEAMLGVPAVTLRRHGAVSRETAAAMVKGALKNSLADIAVSITGIAGPGGGTKQKPVGLVYFAAARRDGRRLARKRLFGSIGRADRQPARLRILASGSKRLRAAVSKISCHQNPDTDTSDPAPNKPTGRRSHRGRHTAVHPRRAALRHRDGRHRRFASLHVASLSSDWESALWSCESRPEQLDDWCLIRAVRRRLGPSQGRARQKQQRRGSVAKPSIARSFTSRIGAEHYRRPDRLIRAAGAIKPPG
jgi:nicotinamide-nucleotide amidase